MALYLFDSDAAIDYLNRRRPAVSLVMDLVAAGDTLCLCDVVVAELYAGFGANPPALALEFLESCRYLETTIEIARQGGVWRYEFRQLGTQLATTDTLIAAIALGHRATIVTANLRHFPMQEVSVLALPR